MGIFGWSLPPGVSMRDIDPGECTCEVCGKDVDECVCPDCPVCHEQGNPKCYTVHGLQKTKEQEFAIKESENRMKRQKDLEQEMADSYLEDLES